MDASLLKPLDASAFSELIPLFPLPNAVMLPGTVLPLHVFEERYRVMTRDALQGSRLIAMALLQPGYEATYHTPRAAIHSTVCVGRILREERLPDGRYNFLLHGLGRARVMREDTQRPYRRGLLEPVHATPMLPEEEAAARRRIRAILSAPPFEETAREGRWLDLFQCPDFCFSDLIDVLVAALLPCPDEKQKFLAEPSTSRRAQFLCSTLSALSAEADVPCEAARPARTRSWPPTFSAN